MVIEPNEASGAGKSGIPGRQIAQVVAGLIVGAAVASGVALATTSNSDISRDKALATCVAQVRFAADEAVADPGVLEAAQVKNSVFNGADRRNVLDTIIFQEGVSSPGAQAAIGALASLSVATDQGEDLEKFRGGELESQIKKSCSYEVDKWFDTFGKISDSNQPLGASSGAPAPSTPATDQSESAEPAACDLLLGIKGEDEAVAQFGGLDVELGHKFGGGEDTNGCTIAPQFSFSNGGDSMDPLAYALELSQAPASNIEWLDANDIGNEAGTESGCTMTTTSEHSTIASDEENVAAYGDCGKDGGFVLTSKPGDGKPAVLGEPDVLALAIEIAKARS